MNQRPRLVEDVVRHLHQPDTIADRAMAAAAGQAAHRTGQGELLAVLLGMDIMLFRSCRHDVTLPLPNVVEIREVFSLIWLPR
jgi:hypothetical protein